jgi:hypothetical protein
MWPGSATSSSTILKCAKNYEDLKESLSTLEFVASLFATLTFYYNSDQTRLVYFKNNIFALLQSLYKILAAFLAASVLLMLIVLVNRQVDDENSNFKLL